MNLPPIRHAIRRMCLRAMAALLMLAGAAQAADPCPMLGSRQSDPDVATRVAATACTEHLAWYRPFIDLNGRLASSTVVEAEGNALDAGAGAVWRRVATYWNDAGLLQRMGAYPGAMQCAFANVAEGGQAQACRSFVVDQPWSAAFVSWTLQRAGVPGFAASPRHFDYVRAARRDPQASPYLFQDPATTAPATGDLLCYVRTGRVYGYAGLAAAIDAGVPGLNMHCDIVVAANAGNSRAWLIGGNVQQAVTMRMLNLNAGGRFWNLPMRSAGDVACSPDAPAACDFNRQDWAVLLKLKPQSQLALLGSTTPPVRNAPAGQACCVRCVLGAVPAVPRCPVEQDPLLPESGQDAD